MFSSKKQKIVQELIKSKNSLLEVNLDNSLVFASNLVELIKNSTGDKSEYYRIICILLYDQNLYNKLTKTIVSPQKLIIERILHQKVQIEGIIDSCIKSIEINGLYKIPQEKKNFLSTFDNRTIIWAGGTIIVIVLNLGIFKGKEIKSLFFNSPTDIPNPVKMIAQLIIIYQNIKLIR